MLGRRAYAHRQTEVPGLRDLRRGVGIFIGPGGTIGWLANRDGAVTVDSQFPATAATFLDGLRKRSPAPRVVLINTHHHGDHTAGNVTLRPVVQQIVQHERCAAAHRQMLQTADAAAKSGLADVTFTDRWSTDIGDERVTAMFHGAAHTGGDAIVIFERANVIHLGDLVFNGVPPFVDRAAGASIRNWIVVLETILRDHAGAAFIFGHGARDAVTGAAPDVARFRDYLSAVLDHVQRGIAAGRSQAEIVAITAIPGFVEYGDVVKNYPSAFPQFSFAHVLTAAYQELTDR
jgi:glyoxylase-like metal-dependent hydrolase (beta-lactamase superfamily II)